MNGIVVLLIAIVVLAAAYVTYGAWLAKQWGVDPSKKTPAEEMKDGVDYVPAAAPVLMGHHFSSIAGAGPINGPIQAAVFGWVPVLLWVLIGGIFFGAVHDYGSLFASIRNKGQSIGEVIATTLGGRMKKLFVVFSYLTLLLVVAAFASIVAGTFGATYDKNEAGQVIGLNVAASATNATIAMISLLFILIAIAFGYFVYRRNMNVTISTVLGVVAIIIVMVIGINFHPIYLPTSTWMWIVGVYVLIASVAPVWILLQPRDYLSSFLLYFMMLLAIIGILAGGGTTMAIPAFTGFSGFEGKGVGYGYLFPGLFVTIACGAISGFHSLVGSGTTSKQLAKESDARPIAYGGMLIESLLAVISLTAAAFLWRDNPGLAGLTPTAVFGRGIAGMLAAIPFLSGAGAQNVLVSLLTLTVSVFCLTSLDTATRLARFMFQEFWLEPGQTHADAVGYKKVLTNPWVATVITVILWIGLGMSGYAKVWPLFGAANQLLAALALLAVAAWLGKMGKNNKMFFIPMCFMLIVTIVSLLVTIKNSFTAAGDGWATIRGVIAILLVVLAVVLAVNAFQYLFGKKKAA
ncbi:MAG: carbon starvation protein A [Lachnospiraceae bacterium]|jgi:carbon starvation protein|nr:carbon starvation protein A [Lachnospiraceae bacterium]